VSSFFIEADTCAAGSLHIDMHRWVIDSKVWEGGEDVPFTVVLDGERVDAIETRSTDQMRSLRVWLEGGLQQRVEIVGSGPGEPPADRAPNGEGAYACGDESGHFTLGGSDISSSYDVGYAITNGQFIDGWAANGLQFIVRMNACDMNVSEVSLEIPAQVPKLGEGDEVIDVAIQGDGLEDYLGRIPTVPNAAGGRTLSFDVSGIGWRDIIMSGIWTYVPGTTDGGSEVTPTTATAAAGGLVMADGGSEDAPTRAGDGATVTIPRGAGMDCADRNECYVPHRLVVTEGTRVTWANTGVISHGVTGFVSGAEAFDSGMIRPGGEFAHVFDRAGVYEIRGSIGYMEGVVVVEERGWLHHIKSDECDRDWDFGHTINTVLTFPLSKSAASLGKSICDALDKLDRLCDYRHTLGSLEDKAAVQNLCKDLAEDPGPRLPDPSRDRTRVTETCDAAVYDDRGAPVERVVCVDIPPGPAYDCAVGLEAYVVYRDYPKCYEPGSIVVLVGDTVAWYNHDSEPRHVNGYMLGYNNRYPDAFSAADDERGIREPTDGILSKGSHKFNYPGLYVYHDPERPGFLGTVRVLEPAWPNPRDN